MKKKPTDKVRRFTPIEVGYHACQGILYLALFLTGGLLMLQRILDKTWFSSEQLSRWHKIIGITLVVFLIQTIILGIFSPKCRVLWKNLREALHWSGRDIMWLIKIPMSLISPRVSLPPSRRFNPGQTIHLLVVTLVLIGFSISGLLMLAIPGSLGAWLIHIICFVPALLFLGLHLFLSLINPPTRKAIKGMITGFVPRRYAQEHHALWIKGDTNPAHAAHLSQRAVVYGSVIALIVTVSLIGVYGFAPFDKRVKVVSRDPVSLAILPGPLSRAHAEIPEAQGCMACHNNFSTPTNEKCLVCHDKITAVLQTQSGYHGTLTGQCVQCHNDHKGADSPIMNFDKKTFNHNLAKFVLRGQHETQDCEACHQRINPETRRQEFHFIGLPFTNCTDCHSDPHDGQLDPSCTNCHNEQGWTGRNLLFEHNTHSEFRLDKIHEHLACRVCHAPAPSGQATPFRGLAQSCEQCHQDITQIMQGQWQNRRYDSDPHAGRVICSECHNTDQSTMSSAEYAQKCSRCHNEHYRKLYFDWLNIVEQQQLDFQNSSGNLKKELTDQIKTVGFHNLQLTRRLGEMYLSKPPAAGDGKESD